MQIRGFRERGSRNNICRDSSLREKSASCCSGIYFSSATVMWGKVPRRWPPNDESECRRVKQKLVSATRVSSRNTESETSNTACRVDSRRCRREGSGTWFLAGMTLRNPIYAVTLALRTRLPRSVLPRVSPHPAPTRSQPNPAGQLSATANHRGI